MRYRTHLEGDGYFFLKRTFKKTGWWKKIMAVTALLCTMNFENFEAADAFLFCNTELHINLILVLLNK